MSRTKTTITMMAPKMHPITMPAIAPPEIEFDDDPPLDDASVGAGVAVMVVVLVTVDVLVVVFVVVLVVVVVDVDVTVVVEVDVTVDVEVDVTVEEVVNVDVFVDVDVTVEVEVDVEVLVLVVEVVVVVSVDVVVVVNVAEVAADKRTPLTVAEMTPLLTALVAVFNAFVDVKTTVAAMLAGASVMAPISEAGTLCSMRDCRRELMSSVRASGDNDDRSPWKKMTIEGPCVTVTVVVAEEVDVEVTVVGTEVVTVDGVRSLAGSTTMVPIILL